MIEKGPVVLSDRVRGNGDKWKHGQFSLNIRKPVFVEGAWALSQVSQGRCGVSILGDTQKTPGHGPGQTALGEGELSGGWTRWLPPNLSHSVNTWSHLLTLSVAAPVYNINPSCIMINKIALIPEGLEGLPKHSANLLQEELRKCFISSNHI